MRSIKGRLGSFFLARLARWRIATFSSFRRPRSISSNGVAWVSGDVVRGGYCLEGL